MNTSKSVISTYGVSGMTCDHCVRSVTAEVGGLAGAESVTVDLVTGGVSTVTVVSAAPLDREDVAAAIDEAGYELVAETL
jgi:copper chaperone CopZ